MKKISKSNKLLISIILRVILSTIISILSLSLILSLLIYKFDLPLDIVSYLSIIITSLSSFIVAFISLTGIKNNGLIIGLISQIPLVFLSLIDTIVYSNEPVIFLIKIALMIVIGALTGYIKVNKNKHFKVR